MFDKKSFICNDLNVESTLLVCSNGSTLSQKKNLSSSTSSPTSQGEVLIPQPKLIIVFKEIAGENSDIEMLTRNEKQYLGMAS